MNDDDIRLTQQNPYNEVMPKRAGLWYVLVRDVYVGKLRLTDGEWNASVWRKIGVGRQMVSIAGTWRTRRAALIGLIGELEDPDA